MAELPRDNMRSNSRVFSNIQPVKRTYLQRQVNVRWLTGTERRRHAHSRSHQVIATKKEIKDMKYKTSFFFWRNCESAFHIVVSLLTSWTDRRRYPTHI